MNTFKYPLLLLLFVLGIQVKAQDSKSMIALIESTYKQIPGTNFLVSECECTNDNYQLFLNANPVHKEKYQCDSSGWTFSKYFPNMVSFNEPMAKMYTVHPKYKTYPVVNITQDAAMAYCNWLTQVYNASPNRKFKKVEFRLPNNKEWETAAMGVPAPPHTKKVFPWDGLTLRDFRTHLYLANFVTIGDYNIKRDSTGKLVINSGTDYMGSDFGADGYMYSNPCKSAFQPNDFGLYNMAGNVAEYTNEIGLTKGGSFMSPAYYLMIKTSEKEFPNMQQGGAFIGFRPFMFVLEY
ncbi:MAG: formylglycine-generating enzyme family protein [Bacteroidia bacterium]